MNRSNCIYVFLLLIIIVIFKYAFLVINLILEYRSTSDDLNYIFGPFDINQTTTNDMNARTRLMWR